MLFSIRGEIQIKNQKNTFKTGLPKVFDLLRNQIPLPVIATV